MATDNSARQRSGPNQEGRAKLSPAVMALTVEDFFDLHYHNSCKTSDLTMEEFLRMHDNAAWPDTFVEGDPMHLFTEDMCRRGQFVPLAWYADGLYVATSRPEEDQDALAQALDMIVQLEITLYSVDGDRVQQGIDWLYQRGG